METRTEQQERIAKKIEKAKWPDGVSVPKPPRLKLTGGNGNAFSILGEAKRAADKAKWSADQWQAFRSIAMAGDYDHLLSTCMQYFDVR